MKGKKLLWTITRILTFIIVGLFNTLLIRTEDIGTWKNYFGYAFILLAIIEIILLIKSFMVKSAANPGDHYPY